nr:uncharacterized protein LOC115264513 [Aedes albopictus]
MPSSSRSLFQATPNQPGRTQRSTLGAPSDPVTVEPIPVKRINPASCRRSRPGPVHGGLEGVFQPAPPGKYACFVSHSVVEVPSISSCPTDSRQYADQLPTLNQREEPGRTQRSTLGAPSDPVTVEPTPVIRINPASCRRSRPGPVHGGLEGVFQPAPPGNSFIYYSAAVPSVVSSQASSTLTLSTTAPRIPGCTLARSLKEAPIPPTAVEPLPPAIHSRPGPACELDDGVFRTQLSGKYDISKKYVVPDSAIISSTSLQHPEGKILLVDSTENCIRSSIPTEALTDARKYDIWNATTDNTTFAVAGPSWIPHPAVPHFPPAEGTFLSTRACGDFPKHTVSAFPK